MAQALQLQPVDGDRVDRVLDDPVASLRDEDRRGGRYDYAAIGNAVILAARLSGKAATGQILVSQRCYGVVEDAIDAVAVDGLELKGLSHPVTAWNVTGLREAG